MGNVIGSEIFAIGQIWSKTSHVSIGTLSIFYPSVSLVYPTNLSTTLLRSLELPGIRGTEAPDYLLPMIIFGTVSTVMRKDKIIPKKRNDIKLFPDQQNRCCARPFLFARSPLRSLHFRYVSELGGLTFVDRYSLCRVWERLLLLLLLFLH